MNEKKRNELGQFVSQKEESTKEEVRGIINMTPRMGGDAPMITEFKKDSGEIARQYPLPYNTEVVLPGKWEFKFYVKSTAGGGAQWDIESIDIDYDKDILLQQFGKFGKYSTLLTGYIENPTIIWLSRRHGFVGSKEKKQVGIIQNFRPGFNFFTGGKYLGGKEFIVKKERRALLKLSQEHKKLDWKQKQGHLEFVELINMNGLKETGVNHNDLDALKKGHHATIFNHQCLGGEQINSYRVENTGYTLVYFSGDDGGWIVSPDHINEAASTNSGYYLLRHPIPSGGVD